MELVEETKTEEVTPCIIVESVPDKEDAPVPLLALSVEEIIVEDQPCMK